MIQSKSMAGIRGSNERLRGGFSFTEILFAVLILGIGFIMVAAMFPVAIKQTSESIGETTLGNLAHEGASYMQRIASATSGIAQGGTSTSITFAISDTGTAAEYVGAVVDTISGTGANQAQVITGYNFATKVASIAPATWYTNPDATTGYSVTNFPVTTTQATAPAGVMLNMDTNRDIVVSPAKPSSFWWKCSGDMILSSDPRFAWIPFYSRAPGSKYAQIVIIGVQAQNTPTFTAADLTPVNGYPNLQGKAMLAKFTLGVSPAADTATFYPDGTGGGTLPPLTGFTSPGTQSLMSYPSDPTGIACLAPGAFVIISDDSQTSNPNPKPGTPTIPPPGGPVGWSYVSPVSCNGNVYQLGSQLGTNQWTLVTGNDLKASRNKPIDLSTTSTFYQSNSVTSQYVRVFVVGRGYNNPAGGDSTFTGPSMAVSAYSTFIKVQ